MGRNSQQGPFKNEAAILSTQLQGSLHCASCTSVFFFQKSWIGSLMPLSALIGGIAGGPLIETIGRKTTILATAVPFIVCKYMTQNVWPSAHTLEVSTYDGASTCLCKACLEFSTEGRNVIRTSWKTLCCWHCYKINVFRIINKRICKSKKKLSMPLETLLSKRLALRRLMSYIYGAPILDVSRSHTTTQHSR